MKKWYFILALFGLALFFGLALPIYNSYKLTAYNKEFMIHRAVSSAYGETIGDTSEGTVELADSNLYYFERALSVSDLKYCFFKPDTEGMPFVSVTYYDGAEFELYDAGENDMGKDIVYLVYTYEGRITCFKLEAYGIYDRIYQCVSPGGFNGENLPVS